MSDTGSNHEDRKTSRSLRKLADDVTGTFGTRMITMCFGLVTGMITARALGPENRGIFGLVALFPATLVTLSKLGQNQASIYFIRRRKADVSQVAANTLIVSLVSGAVLITATLLLREGLVASILRGVPLWALFFVLPMIPVLLVESAFYGVLQSTDRFRVYNIRLLSEAVLSLSGMAFVLLVLRGGLFGALCVVVTIRVVMAVWVAATIHRGTPLALRFDVPLFKDMMRYGLKSHLQIIASHFHFKADIYMVAYFLNPAQVAFYAIAARLAEHIMWMPQSLGLALFPRLAGSSDARAHTMTATACRQTLLMTAIVAAALMIIGPPFISLWYGHDYAPAGAPLPWVATGIVMMSQYVLLSRNFTSRNKQAVNIVAAYVALGGNIGMNLYLIPRLGITGAAMATAMSYSAAAVMLFACFLKDSGLAWYDVLLVKRSDLIMWRRLLADFWADFRPVRA